MKAAHTMHVFTSFLSWNRSFNTYTARVNSFGTISQGPIALAMHILYCFTCTMQCYQIVYVRRLIGCMVKYISIKPKPHPLNIYVYIPHPSPLATHDHWPVILHISYLYTLAVCMVNTLWIHTYIFWRLFNILIVSWCSPWLMIELYYIHPYFM